MDSFPLKFKEPFLEKIDFSRFSISFTESIKRKIVTSSHVNFITDISELKEDAIGQKIFDSISSILNNQVQYDEVAVSHKDCLIFTIPVTNGEKVVVLVTAIDPLVVKRIGDDWLAEIRTDLITEYILLKQARIDLESGLFNGCNLHHLLGSITDYNQVGLILIDLPPKNRKSKSSILHIIQASNALRSFVGEGLLLHHLGQSIFAIVLIMQKEGFINDFSSSLVGYLKNEKFHRVHVGCSRGLGISLDKESNTNKREQLLDEAWSALQIATKRGPFSFCDYKTVAHPESHPLCKPSLSVLTALKSLWKTYARFSLVQIYFENNSVIDKFIGDFEKSDGRNLIRDENSVYLIIPNKFSDTVEFQVSKILGNSTGKELIPSNLYSIGIATYPLSSFKKVETVLNCKKALLHGRFFGVGSIVTFDAVSLNVSGDILYGDGDFVGAIKEYKSGLALEPENVNLLNSLGVTFVMMTKHSEAQVCFKKALQSDPNNFMALYNFGLGEERIGCHDKALEHFERSQGAHSPIEDGYEILVEVKLSLGKLYCIIGQYQKSIDTFIELLETEDTIRVDGKIYKHLGAAWYGIGRLKQSIKCLQKALRFDEFDSDSLSLLGVSYLEDGQGQDIALSFCEKSVDLNPHKFLFIMRLAIVQIACAKYDDARENLRKCLRREETRIQASEQMLALYTITNNSRRVAYWSHKLSTIKLGSPQL